jgi:pyrimidine-nucleoside phosphorylase
MALAIAEIIRKKRDQISLNRDELALIIDSATKNSLDDAQLGAFLMACFINGLNEDESKNFTDLMRVSGKTLDLSSIEGPKVDKHSTGGVGDKTSMLIAPIVASCGASVPMITGRGLGHTGGTSDKLESIPGFKTEVSTEDFTKMLKKCHVAMICQSSDIAPADKKIYSVRDVTATIESIPLITASIMSKKLAEDLDALVLDVKVGSGAFMSSLDAAENLSRKLIETGKQFGVRVSSLITSMNQPLGLMVGNSNEIEECIQILKDEKLHPSSLDLLELSKELSAEMLLNSGISDDIEAARSKVDDSISTGKALEKFIEMVEVQGGDTKSIENTSLLPKAKEITDYKISKSSFIKDFNSREIGYAASELGGGRFKSQDPIDHSVGLEILKKKGQYIEKEEPFIKIHHNGDETKLKKCVERIEKAVTFSDSECSSETLILSRQNGETDG